MHEVLIGEVQEEGKPGDENTGHKDTEMGMKVNVRIRSQEG